MEIRGQFSRIGSLLLPLGSQRPTGRLAWWQAFLLAKQLTCPYSNFFKDLPLYSPEVEWFVDGGSVLLNAFKKQGIQ